jgi:polysaccharide deacetylase 2 family uncharacterized protein YibQ
MSAQFDELSRPLGLPVADATQRDRATWKIGLVVTLCSSVLFGAGALHLRSLPDEPGAVSASLQAAASQSEPETELSSAADDGTPVVRAGFPPHMPDVTGTIARTPNILSAGLLETGRFGMLPRIALDGTRPGDAYARPRRLELGGRPKIALVVETRSLDGETLRAASRLPGDVTMSFSAALDAESGIERLRREGREVWLRVPMEPLDYPLTDPGPKTLTTSASAAENIERLHWSLSRFTGYAGVLNEKGDRLLVHEPALVPVLKELADRGLLFVEDAPPTRSLVPRIARGMGLRSGRIDLSFDADRKGADLDAALAKFEAIAKKRGAAALAVSASPDVMERLAEWSLKLEARGFALVPLSAVVRP